MIPLISFPHIDPVAIRLGPIQIHWYALAYIVGILFAAYYGKFLLKRHPSPVSPEAYEHYIFGPALFGCIIGGRLGHVVFYDLSHYLAHPLEIFTIWRGGMSFHGAVIGVILGAFVTARKFKLHPLALLDILAVFAPVGLGLGRITNFINGELYGRITDSRLGIIFPGAGDLPRHPTQIYEAIFEGLILFEIMRILFFKEALRNRRGFLGGIFLTLYGVFRFGIEFFKDPIAQGGSTWGPLTQGHMLCIPMILFGLYLVLRAPRNACAIHQNPSHDPLSKEP